MTSVKTCSKCGWELPTQSSTSVCPICHEPFKTKGCSYCGQEVPVNQVACGKCARTLSINKHGKVGYNAMRTKIHKAWRTTIMMDATKAYEDWCNIIKEKPYKALTNSEWTKACIHFNGCALCDSEEITTRGMLVPFKDGGRYSAWNVIPICDKCAQVVGTANLFLTLCKSAGNTTAKKIGASEEKLYKALAYLETKL